MPNLRIRKVIVISLIVFSFSSSGFAQHSLSIRGTPMFMGKVVTENPTPLRFSSRRHFSFDAGIEYNYTFKDGWGIGGGTEMGLICWSKVFQVAGFQMAEIDSYPQYFYNAVTLYGSYTKRLGKFNLRAYAGPGARYYHHGTEGIYFALSNGKQTFQQFFVNASDYLKVDGTPPNDHLQIEAIAGLSIEKPLSRSSILVFGIRKDWGLQPISDGEMTVRIDNQVYKGIISPYSDYLGIDFAFKYNFPGKTEEVRGESKPRKFTNSRKSLYGEFLGNGPGLSLNYDRRFNNDRNGGLGYRIGVGVGTWLEQPTLPMAINYLLGNGRNALEAGIGITPEVSLSKLDYYEKRFEAYGFLNLGYRFQPLRDGLLFRLTYAPEFDFNDFEPVWLGASIGYTFK
jgi:hypothetical protein